jgi:tetratricopeptide (TPR) repeat protein
VATVPWGFFNRGFAFYQSGQKVEAIDSYTAALEREPDFLPAYVNRGLARLDLKQFSLALGDFDRALELGRSDAVLLAGRGCALEGLGRSDEADETFRIALQHADQEPSATKAQVQWAYAFAVLTRLPEPARQIFQDALQKNAKQPQALYGMAMLAVECDDVWVAMQYLDRALEVNPRFVDARRKRAVIWARQGDLKKATDDINWCLEREPRHGATLYAAACVAAHAADRAKDTTLRRQSLDLLEKAFERGYGRDRASDDADLTGIRNLQEFKNLTSTRP